MRLVHGSGATGLQLVQSYSDSDEDSDGAWEGRLGDRYNPPGNHDNVEVVSHTSHHLFCAVHTNKENLS